MRWRSTATPATGRRCAGSSSPTRSIGRARAARRRCRTGSRRCRTRCAKPIPGSSTGTAARGSSCSPPRGRPAARARVRGVPRRRRSARPGARAQHDRHRLLLRVGELRAARSLAAGVRAPARPGDRAAKLDRESELRARAAYVIALLFRRPEDPELAACAQRLDELIDGESRPQRADDGRVDAVQLSQLEDRRATRPTRSSRASSRSSPSPRSRR